MSGAWPTLFATNVVTGSPALSAETVVATLPGVTVDNPTRRVLLSGWVAYTVGTSGIAVRLRFRRDSITGAVVTGGDTSLITAIAAAIRVDSVFGIDIPGEIAAATYVLTMTVSSGAAASTVTSVYLGATITN